MILVGFRHSAHGCWISQQTSVRRRLQQKSVQALRAKLTNVAVADRFYLEHTELLRNYIKRLEDCFKELKNLVRISR
jgi:hypothetical protein